MNERGKKATEYKNALQSTSTTPKDPWVMLITFSKQVDGCLEDPMKEINPQSNNGQYRGVE